MKNCDSPTRIYFLFPAAHFSFFPKQAHPKIGNVRCARVFVFLITKYVAIYALSYIMPAMYLCFFSSMEIHFQDFDTQAGIRQHAYLGGMKHIFFSFSVCGWVRFCGGEKTQPSKLYFFQYCFILFRDKLSFVPQYHFVIAHKALFAWILSLPSHNLHKYVWSSSLNICVAKHDDIFPLS